MSYLYLTKKEIIDGIKKKEIELYNLTDNLKNDKDVVLAAVQIEGLILKYASDRLKDDKDIVLEAVMQYGWALYHGSDRLKNDKEVVLIAMKNDVLILKHASDILQNDKEFLDILEKGKKSYWHEEDKNWYKDRMEVLEMLREKEFMKKSIIPSDKLSKKVKF